MCVIKKLHISRALRAINILRLHGFEDILVIQPSSKHFGSLIVCFLVSASFAAAPSDRLAAVRIEVIKGEIHPLARYGLGHRCPTLTSLQGGHDGRTQQTCCTDNCRHLFYRTRGRRLTNHQYFVLKLTISNTRQTACIMTTVLYVPHFVIDLKTTVVGKQMMICIHVTSSAKGHSTQSLLEKPTSIRSLSHTHAHGRPVVGMI